MTSIVLITALLLSSCGKKAGNDSSETKKTTPTVTEKAKDNSSDSDPSAKPTEEPAPVEEVKYEFNPHVKSPLLEQFYSQDYINAMYNLIDALREGKDSFECESQEIYDWCMNVTTLAELVPAAAVVVSGNSNDGTTPFENGVGKIYYSITPEEYVKRQADFEALIEEILNSILQADDTDFEKMLKIYDYIATNYTYESVTYEGEGFIYATFMHKLGICENYAGVYTYLLHQAGIDALSIGSFNGDDHAWAYVMLNGEGVHSDVTWALHEPGDSLDLTYFLDSDYERNASGLTTDDITGGLIPGFWLSNTDVTLSVPDEKYAFRNGMGIVHLDEQNKILYYADDEGTYTFDYEHEPESMEQHPDMQ